MDGRRLRERGRGALRNVVCVGPVSDTAVEGGEERCSAVNAEERAGFFLTGFQTPASCSGTSSGRPGLSP